MAGANVLDLKDSNFDKEVLSFRSPGAGATCGPSGAALAR